MTTHKTHHRLWLIPTSLATLILIGTLTLAGCSRYWGIDLVLVGEAPPDIKSVVGDAAASAGFTEDVDPHSAAVRNAIYRQIPGHPENRINFSADFRNGGQYVVVIGCMNHAFTKREEKAFISALRNLRATGLQFTARHLSMVRLPPDLREWLEAMRRADPGDVAAAISATFWKTQAAG